MPALLQSTNSTLTTSLLAGKNNVLWILLGLFLMVGGDGLGQAPNYTYDSPRSKNLDFFRVALADAFNVEAKLNRLIISVDTSPNGEQFILTFGNGIKRIGQNGGLLDFIPNQSDRLSNPMDFAINSEGKFFVATNESNRRFIRVYSPSGNYLPGETLGDGTYGSLANNFKGPTGLAFDKNDNLYVADHYIGNANPPNPSSIKIYRKDASGNYKNNLINQFDNVEGILLNFPYRLAVNSEGLLYVSELGQDNNATVKILQLDSGFNPSQVGKIGGASSQIGAPGSVIIDKFDYVFIADFGNELDLPRLLSATGNADDFFDVFEIIKRGIQNDVFNINVYNPDNSYKTKISTGIDFPVDLAISKCGTLYVNNSIFDGKISSFFGQRVPDISVDFDLEVYQRSSGYDTEKPILAACSPDITTDVDAGKNYATITFSTPTATDNCSTAPVIQTKGPPSGSQFQAETTTVIEFTATDAAGNIESCSFKVIVNPDNSPPASPSFDCAVPSNLVLDLDQECIFEPIDYNQYIANEENFSGSPFIISSEVRNGNTLEASFQVYDGEGGPLVGECSFAANLQDKLPPQITSCNSENVEVTINDGESYNIEDFSNKLIAIDNCDSKLEYVQNPPAGTPINQNTTVSITAKDDAGNLSESCRFELIIKEQVPFTFECPNDQTESFNQNCEFEVPDYTRDLQQQFPGAEFSQTPVAGATVFQSTTIDITGIRNGERHSCNFFVLIADTSKPQITCPGAKLEPFNPEEGFTVPDYSGELVISDNCNPPGTMEAIQTPAPGEVIYESQQISFKVFDDSGNFSECGFLLNLEEQDSAFEITCPEPQGRSKNENCQVVVPNFLDEVTANKDASFSQNPPAGSVISESTTITIAGTAGNETDECNFLLTITDNSPPLFNCPEDKTITFDPSFGFILPDYTNELNATDNCGIKSFLQDPEPGTVIFEDQLVLLYVWDTSDMIGNCGFTVTLSEEEVLDITCPENQTGNLDQYCQFEVPDYSDLVKTNFEEAQITQDPAPGSFLSQNSSIVLTAVLNGQTDSCSFELILTDNQNPVFSCIPEKNITFDAEVGYTVPDYREEANPSDNCTFEWVQTPAPNTVIYASQAIEISATDASGNRTWCSFIVQLTEEEPQEVEITCAEDQTRNLDENCQYLVPDLTNLATATEGATISQSPAEGTIILENQTIRLTATLDGATDFCEFQLILVDNTLPQLNCPPAQVENYNPAIGFQVPDYTGMAGASDNCGVVEVVQTPTEGTTIFGTTEIKLTAKDQAGNVADCTFTLSLTEEEVLEITCIPDQSETLDGNCQFVIPDYTDQASVNYPSATITQSPEAGVVVTSDTSIVLTASLNGDTDICEFKILLEEDIEAPIANCILTGIFELGPNGTLTLPAEQIENNSTDNCGITGFTIDKTEFTTADIGENVITLTVTDTAGNMDTCQTTITIVPNENTGSDFTCLTQTTLELDATGNVSLRAEYLYSGDPGNRVFTLSKDNFNCSNLGSNEVTLSYTGSDGSGSCEINVEVVDNINPVLLTNNINVSLNTQGRATISPQLINNGSYDNCGEITFSLNKNTFTCKDIGENIISLRGEDSSGNISTVTATVIVTGNCTGIPGNPVDYIYIYPNPTPGPFTFEVPQGWIIEKAEVFDSRGRYLITQSFEGRSSYSMDLTGFQDAVYILLLYTNEGKKIVRVIIH